jgi:hypothetical protein
MRKAHKILVGKPHGLRLGGNLGLGMEDYTIINRAGGRAVHLSDFG